MAIFYPSHVTDFHGSEGEKLVYEALHRLSNDYVVFYSFRWLGTITQRRSEGEADFVVFHPLKGVFSIEVKAGDIGYRGGNWIQTNRHTGEESELLQSLAGITISHQSVISLKNYAGKKAKAYEKAFVEEKKDKKPVQPEIIAIEGDGIILKNKKKGDVSEVHRLQIYEGVRKNGNRAELVGLRCFASTNRKELFAMAASYLHGHYDLSKTTVLSNGDGGSGYQFQDFEQMVEGCLDHQHFRDCYHVHEKIRTRLSFCKRELVDRIIRELHQTDDMMKRIPVWMDTARSCARTEEDLEEVDKLQSYLERNAPYIPSLSQRGIHTEIHLGTAETNHRFYSYRMKRQGRSWSSEGMECMVWVLTARKNKTLTQALLYHANGKSYKKMDRAMHKAAVQAERKIAQNVRSEAQKRKMRNYRPGCLEGRIGVYGASSSPMGRLARAIQKY